MFAIIKNEEKKGIETFTTVWYKCRNFLRAIDDGS